jgi:hypothetical protein
MSMQNVPSLEYWPDDAYLQMMNSLHFHCKILNLVLWYMRACTSTLPGGSTWSGTVPWGLRFLSHFLSHSIAQDCLLDLAWSQIHHSSRCTANAISPAESEYVPLTHCVQAPADVAPANMPQAYNDHTTVTCRKHERKSNNEKSWASHYQTKEETGIALECLMAVTLQPQ